MASAIEKVIEIAANNLFDNASVQTCLTAVTDLSNNLDNRVNAVIDSAPDALNTLNELAAALNDDANFATTITNSLATKYGQNDDASFNQVSLEDTLRVDIINENTDSSGVKIEQVLLKDNNVTAHTVDATNYYCSGTPMISATRQANFTDLEVKSGSNNVTVLVTGDSGDMSLEGTLSVDTISEQTSASGVTIDGVLLKDGGVSLSGVSLSKTVQNLSDDLSTQVYYENFNDEDVSLHTDSEMTYVTGRDGTGKALNTVGVTPSGLQWLQTLPAGSKSFSVWLKIPQVNSTTGNYNAIVLDGRDSNNTGYFMMYYKNNYLYINTSDNDENKFPSKVLVDGVVPTIGSWDASDGKQIGGTRYLQDDTWHHLYFELSATDTTSTLTWFSSFGEESLFTDKTSWSKEKLLTAGSDISKNGGFGKYVSAYGDYAIVGSYYDLSGVGANSGSDYIFKKNYDPLTPNDISNISSSIYIVI